MAHPVYDGDDDERQDCEGSLLAFYRRAWREIEPGQFEDNWHQAVICKQLEALARGEIRDIVVNLPPRTGMSTLITVCFPAFLWAQAPDQEAPLTGPHCSFLVVSYATALAEAYSAKTQRLVRGPWYRRHWGHRVQVRDDHANRSDFGNTAGGSRLSVSIEGSTLGRGALIQIIDEPHGHNTTESDFTRRQTRRAIADLATHVTDPGISARILVMSRTHGQDASDYALENWRNPTHVMLPMRFDPDRACPGDPRIRRGELLWPSVWTEESVNRVEGELGLTGAACLLQKAPLMPHAAKTSDCQPRRPLSIDELSVPPTPLRPLTRSSQPGLDFDPEQERRYTGLAVLKAEGMPSALDEGAGIDGPLPPPIFPPLYPPAEHRGVKLHWLRDPDGDLMVAEWNLDNSWWWVMGCEVDQSPEEMGADGYAYHSVVIVPEH